MYVKICGIRDAATAEAALAAGADAIGVVFSERSPRHATPSQAQQVIAAVAQHAATTGHTRADTVLVVNTMPAHTAAKLARNLGFAVLQLHGGYTQADFAAAQRIMPRIWRADSLARSPEMQAGEYAEEHLLLDASSPGGGEAWDLTLLTQAHTDSPWILAGGLTPENVQAAVRAAAPWGVDVSSGVESSPGVKDPERIKRFVAEAKREA